MSRKDASINYQALAAEFSVGDMVAAYGNGRDVVGRVSAVWPGIGMVDVQYPSGTRRHPVEELQQFTKDGVPDPPYHVTTPGGHGTVSVPGGPYPHDNSAKAMQTSVSRVAGAFVKKAVYWAETNRRYRATKAEQDTGDYKCPRCAKSLTTASYKREDGKNIKLLACPKCLFLVRPSDLTGCHLAPAPVVEPGTPGSDV